MAKKVRTAKRLKRKPPKRLKRRSHAVRRAYNPQTGKLTGRGAHAMPRLEALTQKYIEAGMPADEARQRARADLRSGGRGDWRDG